MAGISLERVKKRFGDSLVLDELSLEVHDREFVVLLGPSGCGKSTVLRLIAGLEDPTEGTVNIGERDVSRVAPGERDVAMVFQNYALYPHMSVRRNVEFPPRCRRVPRRERGALVAEAAEALDVGRVLERRPAQLSGGQRQRVALARAIVCRPSAFLLDEPLSNLDATLRTQIRGRLVELQRQLETTMVYVTHDQVEAMTMGDRIAVIDHGCVQQIGPPQEVYDRPATVFVAQFLGSPPMNCVPGELVTDDVGRQAVSVAGGVVTLSDEVGAIAIGAPERDVIVGIRPEGVQRDPTGAVATTVVGVELLGSERHVSCRLDDGSMMTVREESDGAVPAAGEVARLAVEAAGIHLFDAASGARIGP